MTSSKPDNDSAIVQRVREGDASAFRLLVERYQDPSFSLACSVLHNEHDAEDALQEAFIKAYRSLGSFREQSSFATWLYRIVMNTCLNAAEKRGRRMTADVEGHAGHDSSPTGLDRLISSDRERIVEQVLMEMKDDEAMLLRLFYLAELTVQEMMEVTGFKESKVKVTLFRARKSFAEALTRVPGHESIR